VRLGLTARPPVSAQEGRSGCSWASLVSYGVRLSPPRLLLPSAAPWLLGACLSSLRGPRRASSARVPPALGCRAALFLRLRLHASTLGTSKVDARERERSSLLPRTPLCAFGGSICSAPPSLCAAAATAWRRIALFRGTFERHAAAAVSFGSALGASEEEEEEARASGLSALDADDRAKRAEEGHVTCLVAWVVERARRTRSACDVVILARLTKSCFHSDPPESQVTTARRAHVQTPMLTPCHTLLLTSRRLYCALFILSFSL
jgi:hypothetical protein